MVFFPLFYLVSYQSACLINNIRLYITKFRQEIKRIPSILSSLSRVRARVWGSGAEHQLTRVRARARRGPMAARRGGASYYSQQQTHLPLQSAASSGPWIRQYPSNISWRCSRRTSTRATAWSYRYFHPACGFCGSRVSLLGRSVRVSDFYVDDSLLGNHSCRVAC